MKTYKTFVLTSILIWQSIFAATGNEKNHRHHISLLKRSVESTNYITKNIYDGGISKSLIHWLVPKEQSHIIPYESSQFSPLLDWASFDKALLENKNSSFESQINYYPWFAMSPRKTGILQSLETSEWYQKLASHCVDWEPDSYSWNGFLCSGMTDFGINLFIEAIAFKDLVMCAIIGYTTGDSLFCLTIYLARFLFQDYFPEGLREENHYIDGRIQKIN